MSRLTEEISLAQLKRFVERLNADPGLAGRLKQSPETTLAELDLGWDAAPLRKLWDASAADEPDPPVWERFRQDVAYKHEFRQRVRRESCPQHPRLKAWRERQVARCVNQLGAALAEAIVHPPWSVELTRGCSVGCWFCGLSAVGLQGVYRYTPENAREWAELLELMAELLGPAARWGFCYWATDPLDNPDYERFCCDFSDRLGMFPQTTTAQAWRYPERVRELLRLSRQRGCEYNRFSVLTRSQLEKLHQLFTAEEMLYTECVLQNREAPSRKALAGHARNPEKRKADRSGQVSEEPTTIACVSGFVLNMLERSVQLVTPCGADERWPNGYYEVAECRFQDIDQLRHWMYQTCAALPLSVSELPQLRLARGSRVRDLEQGIALESRFQQLSLTHPGSGRALHRLGSWLSQGGHGADELALLMRYQEGTAEAQVREWLTILFERGWLDEEPQLRPS